MRQHLKDFFIPHTGNNYAPHSLQKAALTGMGVMVVLTFLMANVHSFLWLSSDWLVSTILPAVIVDQTNNERTESVMPALKRNSVLDVAATLKAQHMAERGYFAHYSPEGVSPWHWFDVVNYKFVNAGENLAVHFTDSKAVVDAWMASPSHRANIMNYAYTEIGVGVAEGTYEGFPTIFVVQLFGTPLSSQQFVATVDPVTTTVLARAEESAVPAEAQVAAAQVAAVLSESIERTEVVADEIKAETVRESLYSDHMATSTEYVATAESTDQTPREISFTLALLTQPLTLLQLVYYAIALVLVTALSLSVVIEWRTQNPIQALYSAILLMLMYGLYTLHTTLNGSGLIM